MEYGSGCLQGLKEYLKSDHLKGQFTPKYLVFLLPSSSICQSFCLLCNIMGVNAAPKSTFEHFYVLKKAVPVSQKSSSYTKLLTTRSVDLAV